MPRRCSTVRVGRVGLDMVLSASGRHRRGARTVGKLWLDGGLGVLGFDGRSGVALGANAGEPLQPAGQVPVPVAEQRHRRGQQDAADDGGVDQDRHGQPEPHLLEVEEADGDEAREHADHHRGCAGHGPGRGGDPLPSRSMTADVGALRRWAGDYLMVVLPGSTFASARAPDAALLKRTLTDWPLRLATVAVQPGVVAMLSTLTCCAPATVATRTRTQPAAPIWLENTKPSATGPSSEKSQRTGAAAGSAAGGGAAPPCEATAAPGAASAA